jgi:signal transduction histidine kinase/ActR/RegA family two-component response regulator
MLDASSVIATISSYFGAQSVPALGLHERDRALQRVFVCGIVAGVWLVESWFGRFNQVQDLVMLALTITYIVASLAHRHRADFHSRGAIACLYAFLCLDPLYLIVALAIDPRTLAFLHPLVLVVLVRSGIRFGLRTMYLAWSAALVGTPLLLTNAFWANDLELLLSFCLMLLSTPVFFSSLIRRVHNVRAIEEERARVSAMNEIVVARSAFLAKVSHELRSPLQGIVSALDVLELRHGRLGDDEMIARIRRSSLLLNTHLRDLLTLARGEAGRLEMRPEPFEACALIESVAAAAAPLASAKRLALTVALPPHTVFVVADGARIDQILTNLVINSIRYTDAGQVRLSMRPFDPASRLLRFAVSDTGPGIPADVLPTLLAPDRAQTGAERRGEGSGIGLAIVRTLVDHLGGKVEVTSALGQGTTFFVEIPAEPVLDAQEDRLGPGGATGRVLVVDDRDDVLDALASVVDELGFECDRAPSAAVGANLLASRSYDLALLDLEMPLKGGIALAADTRSGNGPNRATRFVAMSASAVDHEVGRHFHACLSKPIDQAALRQVLLSVAPAARPSQPGLWIEGD